MYLKSNHDWSLDCTDAELTTVLKCLEGDDLTEREEDTAMRMAGIIRKIREAKTKQREPYSRTKLNTPVNPPAMELSPQG